MAHISVRTCIVADFDYFHYVPVLYARAAEFTAVNALTTSQRARFTPIWVIPPIAADPRTGIPKKTLEAHVANTAGKLVSQWGSQPAFFDPHQLRGLTASSGVPAPRAVLDMLQDAGLSVVPVLRSDATIGELDALAGFAVDNDVEVALRVQADVWAEIGSPTGDAALQDLVDRTKLDPNQIHLILDLQDQVSDPPNISAAAVRGALSDLDALDDWRTITVLGTSMPATTSDVGRDSSAELPRSEWAMWKILKDSKRRRASFGDYAIQSVDALSTYNPLFMQTSAQLRYTVANCWFVARGRSTKTAGHVQIHSLAAQVVAHAEFSGPTFSWGDKWIADCAARAASNGNATTWRQATTNHHLAFVLKQLANLRGL